MNALIVGLYGVFLLLVGFNGNADKLLTQTKADAPGFIPWAISIGVLAALYENDVTRDVAKPFIFLVILGFILSNFERLQSEYAKLFSLSTGK